MVGGGPDSIASICYKKLTMHDFHSPFFERHKVAPAICAGKNFRFCYMMKMLEQTVESELEDSTGEY